MDDSDVSAAPDQAKPFKRIACDSVTGYEHAGVRGEVAVPLLDHFSQPLMHRHRWDGFHNMWASQIAFALNAGLLPDTYYAEPMTEVQGRIEIDVATFRDASDPGPATAVAYAPPQPVISVPFDAAEVDGTAVHVLRSFGGPQLRASIELVSPGNKDRPTARRAFAAKCATLLRRGVCVVVVDVVTEHPSANLHADIMAALDRPAGNGWASATQLFAAAYRRVFAADPPRVEAWPYPLSVGAALPELPLWIEFDLPVPLDLEASYTATRRGLRLPD